MGPEFSIFDKLPVMPMLWVRGPHWDEEQGPGLWFSNSGPVLQSLGELSKLHAPPPIRHNFHLIGMSTWASEFSKALLPFLERGQAVP